VALTVLYMALTVLYVALTVLYVALTVLYVALTVLYVALTVLYVALTVLYVPPLHLGVVEHLEGRERDGRPRALPALCLLDPVEFPPRLLIVCV